MNKNDIISQDENELDYFLGIIPDESKSDLFDEWTIWEAYVKGRLPNKHWSEVFDNGVYHSLDVITAEGKKYEYYPIANPQSYQTVLQEYLSTIEEPKRSRNLIVEAAIWSKRVEDLTKYFYIVDGKHVSIINPKLSVLGWIFRILGSLFLVAYIDRLGEFSSSGLGILSKPFEYSLWVGAWVLLWSPIYFAYQRVKHEKPIADQVKKHKDEVAQARNYCMEKLNSIPFVYARQQAGLDIHFDAFAYMVNVINQGRAYDLGQAQNMYEDMIRTEQLNYQVQELQRKVDYNNKMTTINTFTNLMK